VIIAVLGATGVSGGFVVTEAAERGHDVVAIARNPSSNPADGIQPTTADLQSGRGLVRALDGVDAIIDCSNTPSASKATQFFTQAHQNLLQARKPSVHYVLLSIVGAHAVPMAYYKAKAAQERLWAADPHASLVRSTQFHQFAEQMLHRMGLGPVAVIPRMRVQPIAAESAASVLVSVAEAGPTAVHEIAGPREENLLDMARHIKSSRRSVVPLTIPGAAGRAIRDGALLSAAADKHGPSFDDWLTSGRN